MVPELRANFPSKYRRQGLSLSCPSCTEPSSPASQGTTGSETAGREGARDSQAHVMYDCSAFSDLRETYDLDNDREVAQFFKAVVARRMDLEELSNET